MNKKIIISVISIALISIGGVVVATKEPKLQLKKNKVAIEYGTNYTPSIKDLITNYKNFNKKNLKLINRISAEPNHDYPPVGKYSIIIKYKNKSIKQKIIVKDTKAPNVVLPKDIQILQGTDLNTFDFKSLFTIEDLSPTHLSLGTSRVNNNEPGTYQYTVVVKDHYNNTTKKTSTITIVSKPEISEDEEVVQETVQNRDGTTSIKNSIQKRSQTSGKKVISNSSNVTRKTTTNNTQSNSSQKKSLNSSNNGRSYNAKYGSLEYTNDPNQHWQGSHSYGDGAEINGDDFDTMTGGEWKDFN